MRRQMVISRAQSENELRNEALKITGKGAASGRNPIRRSWYIRDASKAHSERYPTLHIRLPAWMDVSPSVVLHSVWNLSGYLHE